MPTEKMMTGRSCAGISWPLQATRSTLLSDTCLVIFVIVFCGVITTLLAVWHKDTAHRDYQHENNRDFGELREAGLANYRCLACPVMTDSEKFCSSDFSYLVHISSSSNLTGTVRTYSVQKIKAFKKFKIKKPKKNKKKNIQEGFPWSLEMQELPNTKDNTLFIMNSTQECNLDFYPGNNYFVSGRVLAIKRQLVFVVTPCDLIVKWSNLALNEHLLYRNLLQSNLCYKQ